MNFLKALYFCQRFYIALTSIIFILIIGHFFDFFYIVGKTLLMLFCVFVFIDIFLIFNTSKRIVFVKRKLSERFSNGDVNKVSLYVKSNYNYPIQFEIIDEIPIQFQKRDFSIEHNFKAGEEKIFNYNLRPVTRGEYHFGKINIYAKTKFSLISRRFRFGKEQTVKVYPSYIQMRKYELMAISNRLTEAGIKKIRRIANNQEFEQIKDYVQGDDIRTINWKATARRNSLMVNQYTDEKSQQVYCLIDMGRTMKMPFDGMTLLDYAINTSLVISNIAMYKQDKAGLITFSRQIKSILPASRLKGQMLNILENLYRQETDFSESNYEALYANIRKRITQRSLLLLFTNFEGVSSMQRQLKFFTRLAKNHLLVVIFFENTELETMLLEKAKSVEEIYIKTIAEKLLHEKRQIVKELNQHGIHAIFSKPQNLTVDTINKYLALKSTGLI